MQRSLVILLAFCTLAIPELSSADDRPNILWLTAEDMSPTLGCYGDEYAITPHIDQLAEQSVRYTHAFATAPVCSPSRSCLITGCYAPSLGTHQMRSAFPIPDSIRGFPALLREAGYFTTNNVKTDYNTSSEQRIIEESWDQSSSSAHWRNRRSSDQPFFAVFNFMTSHQSRSMVWPREQFEQEVQSRLAPEQIHDPASAPVPPYYPDTPVIRRTIARFYDCVTAMDAEVGEILHQLDEDGLADDTIVFFYSDHGSGMPRHKRVPLDSGMHVPLLVRFPDRYRHLAPAAASAATDRIVSFVDFGPTVLSLAGVDVPDVMQGTAFLGSAAGLPRRYAFGHRDRIDEVIDLQRTVRDQRYLYVRTYMPHLGYNQRSAWPDQGEIDHEFYRLANRDRMTDAQWHFAGPTRPLEELYDCEADPDNLVNLAESPEHEGILQRLRLANRRRLLQTHDLGFLPETEMRALAAGAAPWDFARSSHFEQAAILNAAELVGIGSEEALLTNLGAETAAVRYWGAVGLEAREDVSPEAIGRLEAALTDVSPAVRTAVAAALARHGHSTAAVSTLVDLIEGDDLTVVLYAMRALERIGSPAQSCAPNVKTVLDRVRALQQSNDPTLPSGTADLAMFIDFSASAFLAGLEVSE